MLKIQKKNRTAFTMLELIFVIIILGIVSSIGSEIIANIYKNYILQRATHRASLKTELATQQLANYLSYRIPGTTVARNPNTLTDNILLTDATSTTDKIHTVLEWIGSDNDSFSNKSVPGWSGFADIAASTQSILKTPGSNLVEAQTVISNLSNTGVNLDTIGTPNIAIFFRDLLYSKPAAGDVEYDVLTCMGLVSADTSCISTVHRSPSGTTNRDQTLSFVSGHATKKVLVEHYKLAWTAYAVVPFKPDGSAPCAVGESPCDLRLYYNYQPWNGTRLTSANYANIPFATLIKNVTTFKYAALGSTLRIKLCAQESIGDANISICKEKAVIL